MRETNEVNSPFWMLLIRLARWIDVICAKLQQPLIKFSRSPIEPAHDKHLIKLPRCWIIVDTYFGYELSPRPNVAKLTPFKYVGGRRFSNNSFQNARAFAGRSPCPVVDTTNMVRVYEKSASYELKSMLDVT